MKKVSDNTSSRKIKVEATPAAYRDRVVIRIGSRSPAHRVGAGKDKR